MATQKIQLSTKERLRLAIWQDGLLDILIGMVLLVEGLVWLMDQVVFGALAVAIAIPLWIPLRRRFVEPRLGYVRFNAQDRADEQSQLRLTFILGVLVLAGVAIFWALQQHQGQSLPLAQFLAPAIPTALMALAGFVAGLMFGIRMLYVYAGTAVICAALTSAAQWHPGVGILILATVVLPTGICRFVRFVRQYPKADEELS